MRTVREAIGKDVSLMLDMNAPYDVDGCIEFARRVEPVLRQNSASAQVVDLPALIRRQSPLNDHPLAPPVPTPPGPLRQSSSPRPREPRVAPAARRLQEDARAAEATSERPTLLGFPIPGVGRVAAGPHHRDARHRTPSAPTPFPRLLAKLSRRPQMGRPPINAEINTLIRKMAGYLLRRPGHVPHEPCPGSGVDRLLRRSHCSVTCALRPGHARSPSAPGLAPHDLPAIGVAAPRFETRRHPPHRVP